MARKNPSPIKVNTVMHDGFLNFNTSQFQLSADLPKKPKQPRKKKLSKNQKDNKSDEQEGNREVEEEKLKFKNAVWMQYRKQNPGFVFLIGSYEKEDKFFEFKLKPKRGKNPDIVPETVYPDRLKISNEKKKDLLKLCDDKQIPRAYHQYYLSLPSSNTIVNRVPEPDCDEEYEEED
ncbi:hypothetical protein O0L34_g19098 [Tuta absoluta]|nr:hypothetical protein O0L34_g19098 [Tuta absoluta]